MVWPADATRRSSSAWACATRAGRRSTTSGSTAPSRSGCAEPFAQRRASCAVPAQFAEPPDALGQQAVLLDRLETLLAGRDEGVVAQVAVALERAANRLAHAVLREPRTTRGLLDDLDLVRALHQLADLAGHPGLDDREQLRRIHVRVAGLGQPELERAAAALVVRRHRHGREDAGDLLVAEAVGGQPLARVRSDRPLRARARRHPLRG